MKMKKILAGVLASTVAVSAMATSAFAVEETYKPTVGASWQGPMASKGNSAYQIDFGTGTTDSSSQEEIMGEPTTFGVDANGGEWVRFTVKGTWTPTLTGTATVVDFGVDGVPGGDNDTMRKVPVTFTADNPTTLLDESLPEDTYGYGVNVYLAVNRNSLQKAGYLNLDDTEYVMQLDLDMTYWGDEKEGDGVIEDGAANVVTGAVKKHSIDVIYSGTTPTSVPVDSIPSL